MSRTSAHGSAWRSFATPQTGVLRQSRRLLAILLVCGLAGGCAASVEQPKPQPLPAAGTANEGLLPSLDWMGAWTRRGEALCYLPDSLFEYIDGAADLYLAYGFKMLTTVEFTHVSDHSFVVDIYEMGSPLDAFGIYSAHRSPESNVEPIGAEAITASDFIRFYQERYMVDLTGNDENTITLDAMRTAAREISGRIGANTNPPRPLSLLPSEGLIPLSQKYVAQGLLGHAFLPRGLEATYRLKSGTVKGFVCLGASPAESEAAFSAFMDLMRKEGGEPRRHDIGGRPAVSGPVPYHRQALVAKAGALVCGVLDLTDPRDATDLMAAMLDAAKRYQGGMRLSML